MIQNQLSNNALILDKGSFDSRNVGHYRLGYDAVCGREEDGLVDDSVARIYAAFVRVAAFCPHQSTVACVDQMQLVIGRCLVFVFICVDEQARIGTGFAETVDFD